MTYVNSCFISYKHPPSSVSQRHEWMKFAEALESRISSRLAVNLPVYRDNRLQSQPGIKYTKALSEHLCQSVCLVAILQPEYWESSWCMAEWKAMVELERRRLKGSADGLIIPVVYRGDYRQWSDHLGDREPIELKILNPDTQFRSLRYINKIESIASKINRLAREFTDPCVDCKEFVLPIVDQEEHITVGQYKDLKPF